MQGCDDERNGVTSPRKVPVFELPIPSSELGRVRQSVLGMVERNLPSI